MATFDKSRLERDSRAEFTRIGQRRRRFSVPTRRGSRNHPVACAAFDAGKDAY